MSLPRLRERTYFASGIWTRCSARATPRPPRLM